MTFMKNVMVLGLLAVFLPGCGTAENTNPGQTQNAEQVEPAPEETVLEYSPLETDVVYQDSVLKNVETLEKFISDAAENKEGKIRIVNFYEDTTDTGAKGVIIYDLISAYDMNAKQGWIQVVPDLSYFQQSEREQVGTINYNQQCGSIKKDEEQGYYVLNQCHAAWEYRLVLIP
jgi:hypothetical protein